MRPAASILVGSRGVDLAAAEGTDAGEELFQREGLDQVVVGPGVEALDAVGDLASSGQHQNGSGDLLGPQGAGDLHTGHLRQHEVENNDVVGAAGGEVVAFLAVDGDFGHVPLFVERLGDQIRQPRLVFYYENMHRKGSIHEPPRVL